MIHRAQCPKMALHVRAPRSATAPLRPKPLGGEAGTRARRGNLLCLKPTSDELILGTVNRAWGESCAHGAPSAALPTSPPVIHGAIFGQTPHIDRPAAFAKGWPSLAPASGACGRRDSGTMPRV